MSHKTVPDIATTADATIAAQRQPIIHSAFDSHI
jgi:hypothetical protein